MERPAPRTTPTLTPLVPETEAAELLSVAVRTLQAWRARGVGPEYVKLSRSIRYSREALAAFVAKSTRRPAA